jgi:hypothetical protein
MSIPLILATTNAGKSYNLEISRFRCNDTGRELVSSAILYPYSPYSGSGLTKVGNKVTTITSKELLSGAHKVCTCTGCGFDVYLNKAAAKQKSLKTNFYCPVCAADLHDLGNVSVTDEMTMVPESEDEAAMGGNDLNPQNIMPMAPGLDDEDLEDTSTYNGPDEDNVMNSTPVERSTQLLSKKNKSKKRKLVKVKDVNPPGGKDLIKSKNTDSTEEPTAVTTEDDEKNKIPAKFAEEQSGAATDGLKVAAKVNLLAMTSISKAVFDIVPVSDTMVYVFADQKPVITLDRTQASDSIKPLFDNIEHLSKAFTAAIAEKDFNLNNFGGKPIIVAVKIDRLVKNKIKSKTKKIKEAYKALEASMEKDYFDALCLAAVAVNKNVVTGKPNTVKNALISALKEIGVRSPELTVDKAFAAEGESLMRNIMAYAKEYKGKTTSAKKEINKFVAKSAYSYTASAVNTDEDISSHLSSSNVGFATSAASVITETPAVKTNPDVEYYSNLLRQR